jgi:hypothetical protein
MQSILIIISQYSERAPAYRMGVAEAVLACLHRENRVAVVMGHFELTQKRQTIAVVIVRTGKTDDPSIPAVAEYLSHRVTAAVQKVRHIIGLMARMHRAKAIILSPTNRYDDQL